MMFKAVLWLIVLNGEIRGPSGLVHYVVSPENPVESSTLPTSIPAFFVGGPDRHNKQSPRAEQYLIGHTRRQDVT